MSRRIIGIFVCLALLPLAFAFNNPPAKKKGVQTIVIDPGHGGTSLGTQTPLGLVEKDLLVRDDPVGRMSGEPLAKDEPAKTSRPAAPSGCSSPTS